MYIPHKATVPRKILLLGDKKKLREDEVIPVRFAPISRLREDVLFSVYNVFNGPFQLLPLRASSGRFNAQLIIHNAFPMSKVKKSASCIIPDWSLNEMIMSGIIQKDGHISEGVEMCTVTYGVAHATLILKDGEIYKQINK